MNPREILAALAKPFPADAVSWRVGSVSNKDDGSKTGMALAFIDARDVMQRLDEVMGADWQCEYVAMPNGTCCCRIGLWIEGQWRWRSNGAGATDVEAEKGSYSDAMKRAAVLWGVGQYLYNLDSPWVQLETKGRSTFIAKHELPKLRALLTRNGAAPTAPAANAPLVDKIENVEPMKPAPAKPAYKAKAPAPRTAPQEGPRSAVERRRALSETAFNKLIVGDKECRGINQLCNALVQGEPIAKLQDELKRWVARASALRPTLTEKEDSQAVENGYLTFKGMLDNEIAARADAAVKAGASAETGEIAA